MKQRSYILLLALFLIVTNACLFAQDDAYGNDNDYVSQTKEKKQSSKKIITGYVFIDGKYVEPPYRIKRMRRTIYINDFPITEKLRKIKRKDCPSSRKDPGIPPDIKQMDSINVIYQAKIQPYNISYMEAKLAYLYKNYSEEDAVRLTKEYLESMPNIKSVKGSKICEVEAYNGEIRKIVLTTDSYNDLKKGRRRQQIMKNTKRNLLYNEDRYEQMLLRGDIIFIFMDTSNCCNFIEFSYAKKNGIQMLKEISEVINDSNIVNGEKEIQIGKIMKNTSIKKYIPVLIKNFELPAIRTNSYSWDHEVGN